MKFFKAIYLWSLRMWVNLTRDLHCLLLGTHSFWRPSPPSETMGLRDMHLFSSNLDSGSGKVVVQWLLEDTTSQELFRSQIYVS